MPFIKKDNNITRYYKDDTCTKLHREDGPAWIEDDGTETWFFNGRPHRDDGPAVQWPCGRKEWWQHAELKREGGLPVIDDPDNGQWHMINGLLTKTK